MLYYLLLLFCFVLFFVFLGPHPWSMEVSRLGVKSELQLLAYTTATATPHLSHVCDLHASSRQRWILNPWVRPGIKPMLSWILARFLTCWATTGTPKNKIKSKILLSGSHPENVLMAVGWGPRTFSHCNVKPGLSFAKFICSLPPAPDCILLPPHSHSRIHFISFYFYFLSFLGPHPRHMEVPRLGVQLEL